MVTIGILALQGDIRFHEEILEEIFRKNNISDGKTKPIKYLKDLNGIDGLIIPGGESTVIGILAKKVGLLEPLKDKIINGLPTLATCAGLVFLAKMVYDKTVGKVPQPILGILDVDIERNSFGTQRESFETNLVMSILGEEPYKSIFIRAPVIKNVGPNVDIIAKFNEEIVAIKQDNIIGVAFHPELSGDLRIHKFFLDMVKERINE
ncbi:MAG: pyridoxal 5'-phosphate synthase glutaminase subunit PdxT [Promethearchaeota archaeon]